jgi:hypothetical protein
MRGGVTLSVLRGTQEICCQAVARRIVDRRVLHLIKMWLGCPVEETAFTSQIVF